MTFPVREHNILQSETTRYLIIDFIGEGGFSKVARCLNLTTNKVVAIKILKDNNEQYVRHETDMLDALGSLDPDKTNIVGFIESFKHLGLHCMVFEMLDTSVWEMIYKSNKKTMTLNEIRPVVHQLATALDALGRRGIVHTDLKTDNVMLVDHLHRPLKVKLMDFSRAVRDTEADLGLNIQHRSFRAPEVYLGAPWSTAVDMWGMGCVMAHMYFGDVLFPYDCPYNWMRNVLLLLGEPDQRILSAGTYTDKYFKRDATNPEWTLMTPYQYQAASGSRPGRSKSPLHGFADLEDAVESLQLSDDPVERRDRQEFLSLLKSCLTFSPYDRISPRQALTHSFLTLVHMDDVRDTSVYAETALHLMAVAVQSDPDDSGDFIKDCFAETSDSNDSPASDVQNPPPEDEDASTPEGSSGCSCDAEDVDDDKSRDPTSSTGHLSMLDRGSEDLDFASPHRDPSPHVSSTSSPAPSACITCASPDVDPGDGAAAADATNAGGVEDVATGPTGSQKNPLFKRLCRFMGRVRKSVRSIFQKED